MATATFDFTGANGAAWPSGWTTAIAGTGAAAVINTNRGALTSKAVAYGLGTKAYLSAVYSTDLDVTLDLTFAVIAEQYFNFELRCVDSGSADERPPSSYFLQFFPGNGANSMGVSKRISGTETSLSGNLAAGAWTANVARRVRFSAIGNTLSVKVWDPASAEPGTWLWTGTDTSLSTATGSVLLANASGAAATARTAYVDNFSVIHTAAAVVPTVPNQSSGILFRTTPAGTPIYKYRVVTDAVTAGLTGAQKDAYLYVPESKSSATSSKFVMAAHGYLDVPSGFMEQANITLPLLDRLADAGYVVIVPVYEATFGNDDGQARMLRAYNYLTGKWAAAGTVLFGFSMGGATSAVALHKATIPGIKAAQLVAPLVDWAPFNSPTYGLATQFYTAWNTDEAGFAAATAGADPIRQANSKYAGARIRIQSSPEDGYSSIRSSSVTFLSNISSVATQAIDVQSSGGHGTAEQFVNQDQMFAFFETATALTVPLSGSGTLTATAVPSVARTVALSGSGTLTRSVVPAIARTVGLSGSGTLTRSVVPATTRSVGLSGSGTLAASAAPATTRSVGLSGSGTLAGSVASATTRTVALSGSGTLTGVVTRQVSITANLSGGGTLSGGITGMSLSASAALSGSGTLVAGGVNNAAVPGNLSGSGALSPSLTSVGFTVTKGLSGSGTLTSTVKPDAKVSLTGSGQGSLSASAVAARTVQVQLSGVGTLVGVGTPVGVPDPMYNYDVFAYLAEKRWSGSLGLQRKGSR